MTRFAGKTWTFVAAIVILGPMSGVFLILGPLFLFGIMRKVDGSPGTDGGIALCIMAVPTVSFFALALYGFVARQEPILQLFEQGIEVKMIGVSSLRDLSFLSLLIRVVVHLAWLVVSRQGFRSEFVRCRWCNFSDVRIGGLPFNRTLTLDGNFERAGEMTGTSYPSIIFSDSEFAASLDQISQAIRHFVEHPSECSCLPAWRE